MEAHPVPQNITAFEFHLIGNMTIKQFAYLAVGCVTAYLTYILFYSAAPIVAIPVIVISASLGAAFAFLPIQDRPLDHWTKAFFKAVYSPTQWVWKGNENPELFKKRLEIYFHEINIPQPAPAQPVQQTPQKAPVQPASAQLSPRIQLSKLTPQRPPTVVTQPIPTPVLPQSENNDIPSDDQLNKTVELAKEAQLIQIKIVEAEKQISYLRSAANVSGNKPATYNLELQKVFENLQGLIKHAQEISKQLSEINTKDMNSGAPTNIKPLEIKEVQPTAPKKNLPVLTSMPNVINGIVMDAAGNYLDNVVVVIHNHDGLPVRALKTNKLGQFTGATPLPSGPYTVTLEKEHMEFDTFKITLNDLVLSPVEVYAKKEGVVAG